MTSDVLQAVEAGCSMHIGKPFTGQAFFEMLARFLPRSEGQEESPTHAIQRVIEAANDTAIIDSEMLPLLRDFIDRLPSRVNDMKSALAAGDSAQIALLAHRLKGSAGLYGFPELSHLSSALERDSHLPDLPASRDLLGQISSLIESISLRKEQIVSERAGSLHHAAG
jgi:HPt (histidine-containing phosphotransfer) domain-containing protein